MTTRSLAALAVAGLVVGAGLAAVPTAAVADGSTLYVNNKATAGCSDTAAGAGSQATPYCTVQAAADVAQPGDTVQVAPGSYAPVTLTRSGGQGAPITFTGQTGVARPALVSRSPGGPAFTFDQVHDVVVHGFQIVSQMSGAATEIDSSSDITLDGDQITGNGIVVSDPAPAVAIDGQSSGITLIRNLVTASRGGSAVTAASGTTGLVLTTNAVVYYSQPAVTVTGSPQTVLVSNTFSDQDSCGTAIDLEGASTWSVVENNAVETGTTAGCTAATTTGAPVVVAAAATDGTTYDYNAIETSGSGAPYSWGGVSYQDPAALLAATGKGGHEYYQVVTASPGNVAALQAPLIDSADADAPDEQPTDIAGEARVDDPLVANTGTGVGYYDRGAIEYQDPYTVAAVPAVTKGPAPLSETVTASESNPWHTAISDYTFDFGDGSAPVVSSSPSVSHTYPTAGTYTPKVTATTATGVAVPGYGGTQVQVTSAPAAPLVAALSFETGVYNQTPLTVLANGAGTTDGWSIHHYYLDFGDGSPVVDAGIAGDAYHTYAKPGTYTAKLTVVDDDGNTQTVSRQVTVGSAYLQDGPTRVLDTRYGTGAPKQKVGAGGVVRLKVAGANGVPATGVTAVTLNLTGTDATADTWVAAYPDGSPVPVASTLNLGPGQTDPNLVTVQVGADGYVDLYNRAGSVDLIADMDGYYSTQAPVGTEGGAGFVSPTGPTRVLDTRTGSKVGGGDTVDVHLPDALALQTPDVVLNITETDATASSWVGIGGVPPSTSVLNFNAGQTTSNLVVAPVGPDGTVELYNHSGDVDLIADVQAYVGSPRFQQPGSAFQPIPPTRLLDTRSGLGAPEAPLKAGGWDRVQVGGVDGIPQGVTAVLVNLTGTGPTSATWLAAYAGGTSAPTTSDLNLVAGQTRPNEVLVPVAPDGTINVYNRAGSVNALVDVQGYYIG